jgi:hypothetical protein
VYEATPVADQSTRYHTVGHYFYVLACGNAVNFLHGASVGAFIFLVQAEILAAASRLTAGNCEPGYHEVPDADRTGGHGRSSPGDGARPPASLWDRYHRRFRHGSRA